MYVYIFFYPFSIMSKRGGVRVKHRRQSTYKRTLKSGMPRVHNLSIKLRSLKRSYSSYKSSQNRKAARRAATARRALEAAQRNIDRMARRARGENSNNNNSHTSSAASSKAANRSLRAAERSLAAFGSLGEKQNFVLGAKQKKKRFTRKMNWT
jgi:hypothetical protein